VDWYSALNGQHPIFEFTNVRFNLFASLHGGREGELLYTNQCGREPSPHTLGGSVGTAHAAFCIIFFFSVVSFLFFVLLKFERYLNLCHGPGSRFSSLKMAGVLQPNESPKRLGLFLNEAHTRRRVGEAGTRLGASPFCSRARRHDAAASSSPSPVCLVRRHSQLPSPRPGKRRTPRLRSPLG
jgi:hypothetical protein